ncbi:MAG: hypothetical protein IT270_01855 [Saprospiraceae bacterium]|nr:hypothetical protein [Saprospiraceae bacterium]
MDTHSSEKNPATPPNRKRLVLKNLSARQKEMLTNTASGLSGIMVGTGAYALFGFSSGEEPVPPVVNGNESVVVFTEAPFADGVQDGMGFNEAFAAARAEVGPGGFFEWHGQYYNTYTQQEWEAMSPEQQMQYADALQENSAFQEFHTPASDGSAEVDQSVASTPVPDTPDVDAATPPVVQNSGTVSVETPIAEPISNNDPIAVPEVTPEVASAPTLVGIDLNDDSSIDAVAVDADHDNMVDAILIDSNADGIPDTYLIDSDQDLDIDMLVQDENLDGQFDQDDTYEPMNPEEENVITVDQLIQSGGMLLNDNQPVTYVEEDNELLLEEDLPDIDDDADVTEFI